MKIPGSISLVAEISARAAVVKIRFTSAQNSSGGKDVFMDGIGDLVEFSPAISVTMSMPAAKLVCRFQVADARHRQHGQDMWHIVFADNNDIGSAQRDPVAFGDLVFFAVGHADFKRNAFPDGGVNLISCHNGSNLGEN
jgi:hypothetical protein